MALIFNNSSYNIPEAALAQSLDEIKQHLSTTMAGSGASIMLDGVVYSIDAAKLSATESKFEAYLSTIGNDTPSEERLEGDGAEFYTLAPTALSFRSTAPLNELQEVQINGVTVDPSNYTLEEGSTIVTFPIEYLKTLDIGGYEVDVVSDSKTVKGGFSVKAPELNEYGFYYNQPYTAYVSALGDNLAILFANNNEYCVIAYDSHNCAVSETGSYSCNDNMLVMSSASMGELHFEIAQDGTSIFNVELQTSMELNSELVACDDDYIYVNLSNVNGYCVLAMNKTKYQYSSIKTGINGMPTVKLGYLCFNGNTNLVVAPQIPNSAVVIGESAFEGCINLTSISIPNSVQQIQDYAFSRCEKLTNITLPTLYSLGSYSFADCKNLSSVTIAANTGWLTERCFYNCTNLLDISFVGTVEQWNQIGKHSSWNENVPATYVQCSDGQVAL